MGAVATIGALEPRAAAAEAIATALEANRIVYFPSCPIALPNAETLSDLRRPRAEGARLKNVSYHPEADRVTGLDADAAEQARVTSVLRDHLGSVRLFLDSVLDTVLEGATAGTCSFRPIQERGRKLKPHASNELVHVDAGAYGATDGDRILRFFVNFSEAEDRVWATRGPFDAILERCGREAGVLDGQGQLALSLAKGAAGKAYSSALAGLGHVYPLARVLDTSPYDRAMRRIHNFMKDDDAFRRDSSGYEEIRFPPGSAWMVFTDGVSHACLSGQFAFVSTFIVRRRQLRHPEHSPYSILEGRAPAAQALR